MLDTTTRPNETFHRSEQARIARGIPTDPASVDAAALARVLPEVSAPPCGDVGELLDCEDCDAFLSDGPHGRAHVPSVCAVDGRALCRRCALGQGATAEQLDAVRS